MSFDGIGFGCDEIGHDFVLRRVSGASPIAFMACCITPGCGYSVEPTVEEAQSLARADRLDVDGEPAFGWAE